MSIDKKRIAAVELLEDFIGYVWDEKTEAWVVPAAKPRESGARLNVIQMADSLAFAALQAGCKEKGQNGDGLLYAYEMWNEQTYLESRYAFSDAERRGEFKPGFETLEIDSKKTSADA